MNDYLDDRRLVKQLLAHDKQAFSRFFDQFFAPLYRFAAARLSDNPDATKDIIQVTLSKAIRKLATYRGDASLFTWLCAICRRDIGDYLRRVARDRERVVLANDLPNGGDQLDEHRAPAAEEPEGIYGRLQTTQRVQAALDSLPSHYGNVLEWKYVFGFGVQEIAAKLAVSPESAQSTLARAKRAFREVYVDVN